MTDRVLRPVITFATISAVLLAVLAVYLTFTATESTDANAGHYDATSTQTLTSSALGADRGTTTILTIPGPDHNFSNNVTFEPAGATFTPACNKDGPDGDTQHDYRDFNNDNVIDAGETPCLVRGNTAGQQNSDVFLGVANNACTSSLTVIHDLFVVASPNNELNPRASTNIAFPHVEGASNRFQRWRIGGNPLGANGSGQTPGVEEEVIDSDLNTRAEGGSMPFQNYPSYLLDMFDPDFTASVDGPLPPVVPLAVYGGDTQVAGTWVPLYFAVFDKGDLATAFAGTEPHPFSRMTTAVGYPNQSVLNDPTAIKANASTITDFCTPLVASNTALATVGGVSRAKNPSSAGTHVTMNYSSGLRDADNDGFENAFDSCPVNANTPGEDARTAAGLGPDLDNFGFPAGDMLDSACDPSPSGVGSGVGDHDGDTFPNAQDICPLVSDPLQTESENANGPAGYDVAAIDGGPATDSRGDACDTGSIIVTINNKSVTVSFSSTVGNGHWHNVMTALPKCYGGTDADGDGYCTTQDSADSGACTTAVPPNCTVRHNAWTTTAALSALMNFDTDRGGGDNTGASDTGGISPFITCPTGAADVCPENGFDSDALETYTGTSPAQACAADLTLNNEPLDSWVPDFNDDTRANLSDITAIGPSFNKFVNQVGGTTRTDINSDGASNLSDVTAFGPVFNKQCRRDDGTLFGVPQ